MANDAEKKIETQTSYQPYHVAARCPLIPISRWFAKESTFVLGNPDGLWSVSEREEAQ